MSKITLLFQLFAFLFATSLLQDRGSLTEDLELVYSNVIGDSTYWVAEIQQKEGSNIQFKDNTLDIDVSKGATVWFNQKLKGDVVIQYDITIVDGGGDNDEVSDMNCFWMFTDPYQPDGDLQFGHSSRTGWFKTYHKLQGYYVGLGGYRNTRTRFRRYDGNFDRPLLPEHDLRDKKFMIIANKTYTVTLVAKGEKVQYYRDDQLIFDIKDDAPYREGWFAFRTLINHMRIENFKVYMKKSS
ncbi:DUF6250 domain-containing protein [Flammeovirga aprica]|uniref:Tat pathway signal sequence domain protein n=1 Tax=Flammeovirga aprica JL-4 TaxID=694437 RepID=A0A7X9RT29_9BACT|nr:DUF6250 domain-containing protein [Flammeovirga aprica]NME66769.1 Tat pathway signal sequence domain protein [Flammeovirga aprica JL-4]